MTKPEIEKLAQEYAGKHETRCRENQFHLVISFMELRAAFLNGYNAGAEAERKRCLEICENSIKIHVNVSKLVEESRFIKELIERGSDE